MNLCKGICNKYKVKSFGGKPKYTNGVKRCMTCSIFIETLETRCPCCKTKCRITPRSKKARSDARIARKVVWH